MPSPIEARTVRETVQLCTLLGSEAHQLARAEMESQALRMAEQNSTARDRLSGGRAVEALVSLSCALPCLAALVAWVADVHSADVSERLARELAEFDTFLRQYGADLEQWQADGYTRPVMLDLLNGYFPEAESTEG